MDARQSPSFSQILYGCAAAAAVIGVITSGISMLVSAQFSPAISTLQATVAGLAKAEEKRLDQDVEEFNQLKKDRDHRFEKADDDVALRLKEIEKRLEVRDWAPSVRAAK